MKTLSFVFLFIIVFPGCRKNKYFSNEKTNADYEIAVNEQFQLNLISNPTTGYSWKWVNEQAVKVVHSSDKSFVSDTPVLVGSGGKEIWKFKGITTGVDTIKMEYCRSWEPNSTLNTKTIIVRVK